MSEIRLEGIEKRYGDFVAVRGIDLTIADGEFFTFVGPSGCGKSTILHLIAGLDAPSSGTIRFDGAPVDALAPGDRDVAMVFQNYALYPHMTVYENIAFPLRIRKRPAAEVLERVRETAALLGIEELMRRRPGELSGGQRQRVALGRAIVRRPRAFLMDERLSNLDAALRVEMRDELRRLHRRLGRTTVYVTHDQAEAMVLSDRMAVLRRAEIQQCGRPMELYEDPVNLFVALFVGTPRMVLLDGARLLAAPSPLDALLDAAAVDRKSLLAGVRPADIAVSCRDDGRSIEAEVTLVEPTGGRVWVHGDWRGNPVQGHAAEGEGFEPGQTAFFSIPPGRVLLFDRATGLRIGPG
jgi:ABC-type sugar transport system ATPase subunit